MRLDELVSLNDVLKSAQYIKLLRGLKVKADSGINVTRIKNRVIQAWKKGLKTRTHIDSILQEINLNTSDLLDE